MALSDTERRTGLRQVDSDAVWWKRTSMRDPAMGWLVEQTPGDSIAFLVRGRDLPEVGEPVFIGVRAATDFQPACVRRVRRLHADVHVIAVSLVTSGLEGGEA
ncbi:MAG: hypothetical protein KDA21_07315 [Phycisphaerales bacterium]|nr:hypothetical protein [Phycisphaerales bacterium]